MKHEIMFACGLVILGIIYILAFCPVGQSQPYFYGAKLDTTDLIDAAWEQYIQDHQTGAAGDGKDADSLMGFDIDTTGLVDGMIMKYEVASTSWIFGADAGAGGALAWSDTLNELSTDYDVSLKQPLEATLTDIADGTIAENLVNTANPWADNEIASAATWNARLDSATIVTWPDSANELATNYDLSLKQNLLVNSAGLLGALSDETGTGVSVFSTSPVLVTPTLGVAASTSCTGTITLAGNPTLTSGQASISATGVIFEGATADVYEGLLASSDITASDKTWTLPNASITIAGLTSAMTGTFDGNNFAGGAIGTGDILYGGSAGSIAELSAVAVGNALISGGVSTAPAWGKVGLTTHVSGVLPLANGGTDSVTYATKTDISGFISATLTEEEVEDFVGGMLGGTETRIAVTYDDAGNAINFVVDDMNDDVPEAGDYSNLTAGEGLGHAVTGTIDALVDYDGGLEIVDDSLNIKLNGSTLALSASGLSVNSVSGVTGANEDDVSLSDVQSACTNDFHNIGGTDDDVPDAGDFGAANDLDANGEVADDSHNHVYSNIDATTSANWAGLVSDETGSGAWVFGTSPSFTTSINIPNGADPTVDADGELAYDTNDECLRVYDGANDRSIATVYYAYMVIYDPDGIQPTEDAIDIMEAHADWAPFGITLVSCGIKTDASSTYSVDFEEWTSPADGSPSAIETVATSSTLEAEDDGTLTDSAIAAGSIVYADLPATDIDKLTVWVTYYINPGN